MLFIHFVVPILQITLFCLCVGRKLTHVPIGFLSREVVRSTGMSDIIMNKIDKNAIELIEYKSIGDAEKQFNLGRIFGIIEVGANFSRELVDKFDRCSFSDFSKYPDSQLVLYFDQTNRQMIYAVAEELIRILQYLNVDFNLGIFPSTSSNQTLFKIGKLSNDFNNMEFTFTHFMIPGVMLSVIFFLNVALTALSLVVEQSDGTQERVWIAGVKSNEIVLSQVIVHSVILVVQIIIVLFTALYVLQIPLRGSLLSTACLCLIQGFCGMTFGLVISTVFTTEVNAHQVTMATFYPVLILSGIVWPLEGQPVWMRTITRWLPLTKAIDAMRGILLKGWGVEHIIIQQAYLVTFLWSMVFLMLTLFIFNCRRS